MNKPTTQKALAFMSKQPCFIGRVNSVDLYEHPTLGDECPLMGVTTDGRLKNTGYWELPDATEALELFDL